MKLSYDELKMLTDSRYEDLMDAIGDVDIEDIVGPDDTADFEAWFAEMETRWDAFNQAIGCQIDALKVATKHKK